MGSCCTRGKCCLVNKTDARFCIDGYDNVMLCSPLEIVLRSKQKLRDYLTRLA